ncbi:glycosyltransferase [uncultured Algibacter sp.]|uniref:glycosyltransferase family 2 protein n=1 Tax=uncultured Algibacter sp. TaxID=298659 RepID=UPI0030EC8429|tara:strand:- start:4607 stop:5398 length:792 start_codon:yes stop_codon:yes gene_type:complete
MNDKVSIVIRNKNESKALDTILNMLNSLYSEYIHEIIIVDNKSTDSSIQVAKKHNCKIVNIDKFTYGKAINVGIEAALSNYVLLLSSHAMPIGNHFFYNALSAIKKDINIAGVRFVNSIENYQRAIDNDFNVKEPLKFGLMAACSLINKQAWNKIKFNQDLVANEDKEWSMRVVNEGYRIIDVNETYFYFIKRTDKGLINRYRNETLADYQLSNKKPPNLIRVVLEFIKKIFVINIKTFFKTLKIDFLIFIERIKIIQKLKNQ